MGWLRARHALSLAVMVALAGGCATTQEPSLAPTANACPTPPAIAQPAPAGTPEKPATSPAPTVAIAPEPPAATPEPYRGRLTAASWVSLPGWGEEALGESIAAFRRSCAVLETQPAWREACEAASALPASVGQAEATRFFESRFVPHRVLNPDDSDTGTITGYYEPLLRGSRLRTARYRHPVYAMPQDLVVVDLSTLHPDLRHKRLRGRLEGNRLVPYHSRGEIESDGAPLRGNEIAWVDDPVELFFLHIQGSGQIQLENGERLRVGYAEQNGHPFRSVASLLIRRGELPAERTSLEGMRDWARRHPAKAREYLNANPSFVFFRELPAGLAGPLGTLGVPLTSGHSLAVDPRVIPLGVPVFLDATWPGTRQPLRRLMVAQDTGGAIYGAVRADFYWGFGDEAGRLAGRTKQQGRMWVLLPKGYAPPATLALGATP